MRKSRSPAAGRGYARNGWGSSERASGRGIGAAGLSPRPRQTQRGARPLRCNGLFSRLRNRIAAPVIAQKARARRYRPTVFSKPK